MARTPSIGLDQNQEEKFVDKYWGRVPQFLHKIEEANIYECNPEYIYLMSRYMEGDLSKKNISKELHYEIENVFTYYDTHYSNRPKYINILVGCFNKYMGIVDLVPTDVFPPGIGADDEDCLRLRVHDYDTGEWQTWKTSNNREYIVSYNSDRMCAGAYHGDMDCGDGSCPDCLSYNVLDPFTNLHERLSLDGEKLNISTEPGSCVPFASSPTFGLDCENDSCGDCVDLHMYDKVRDSTHRLIANGERVHLSKTLGSCVPVPEYIKYEMDCDGPCPDCLGVNVYNNYTGTMQTLVLNDEVFHVGTSFESCAEEPLREVWQFGADCEYPCKDCLSLSMYNTRAGGMETLYMDGEKIHLSKAVGSCASVPLPRPEFIFGVDCDDTCGNCLAVNVFDSRNSAMHKLVLDGQNAFLSKTLGSCAQLPSTIVVPDAGPFFTNYVPLGHNGLTVMDNGVSKELMVFI